MLRNFLTLLLVFLAACPARATDRVRFREDNQERVVSGRVLVTAEDGGVLLLAPDGTLHPIQGEDVLGVEALNQAFVPLSQKAMEEQLLSELPAGFSVHTTAHYVIAYNTSRAYAQWVGALYERLFSAFNNFWSNKGLRMKEPELPLVVLVFADRASYLAHVQDELGDAAGAIVGYYSLQTNRVTMYDLTGVEALRGPDDRKGSLAEINRMLSRREAEPMVATIVHEATHQVAFNAGMHERFADIPLWVSEGLAVYFESPDLKSSRGWRSIGKVHHTRLAQFRSYLPTRPADSLLALVANSDRFRDTRQALDAYGEAWALNYFLLRQRPKQYVDYLEKLAAKPPLENDTDEERLAAFREAFGEVKVLDRDFVRYVERLK